MNIIDRASIQLNILKQFDFDYIKTYTLLLIDVIVFFGTLGGVF